MCKLWSLNQHHWPNLARMAKAMLAVPATGAPSEGPFVVALRVMSNHYVCFTSQNLEVQTFLLVYTFTFDIVIMNFILIGIVNTHTFLVLSSVVPF